MIRFSTVIYFSCFKYNGRLYIKTGETTARDVITKETIQIQKEEYVYIFKEEREMPTIYLMIGVPASGKTTWAKEKLKELDNAIYIGSDSIRLELWGNEQDQQHNRETFQEVFNRIAKAAKEKKNIVYDATNISRKEKENILKLLTNDYTKIGVKMSTPIKDCYKRNLKRNRIVPEKVIGKMEVRMTYDMDLFDDYLIVY